MPPAPSPPPATPWDRLVRRASSLPAPGLLLPPGFAARVLARTSWRPHPVDAPDNPWRVRELFAWRGALIAAGVTAITLALNYDLLAGLWYGDTALAGSLLQTFAIP